NLRDHSISTLPNGPAQRSAKTHEEDRPIVSLLCPSCCSEDQNRRRLRHLGHNKRLYPRTIGSPISSKLSRHLPAVILPPFLEQITATACRQMAKPLPSARFSQQRPERPAHSPTIRQEAAR